MFSEPFAKRICSLPNIVGESVPFYDLCIVYSPNIFIVANLYIISNRAETRRAWDSAGIFIIYWY